MAAAAAAAADDDDDDDDDDVLVLVIIDFLNLSNRLFSCLADRSGITSSSGVDDNGADDDDEDGLKVKGDTSEGLLFLKLIPWNMIS